MFFGNLIYICFVEEIEVDEEKKIVVMNSLCINVLYFFCFMCKLKDVGFILICFVVYSFIRMCYVDLF